MRIVYSLALGAYFYASDVGGGINYEYPINSVIGMYDGEPIRLPSSLMKKLKLYILPFPPTFFFVFAFNSSIGTTR